MRKVTGYYFMSAFRYKTPVHSIIVIAPDRESAKEAITRFLLQRGYSYTETFGLQLKPVRNIGSKATVIVADFYKEED